MSPNSTAPPGVSIVELARCGDIVIEQTAHDRSEVGRYCMSEPELISVRCRINYVSIAFR